MGQEPTPADGPEPSATQQPAPPGDGKQEPKVFDETYVKQLRSEAAGHRKEASELRDRLQALEDRDKSDTEKAIQERDRLKSEVDPLKAETQRLRVALAKGLPADLIDRLKGGTQEEMEADAEFLMERFKAAQPEPQVPDFNGGARPPVTPPGSPEDEHQQFISGLLSGRAPTQTH